MQGFSLDGVSGTLTGSQVESAWRKKFRQDLRSALSEPPCSECCRLPKAPRPPRSTLLKDVADKKTVSPRIEDASVGSRESVSKAASIFAKVR